MVLPSAEAGTSRCSLVQVPAVQGTSPSLVRTAPDLVMASWIMVAMSGVPGAGEAPMLMGRLANGILCHTAAADEFGLGQLHDTASRRWDRSGAPPATGPRAARRTSAGRPAARWRHRPRPWCP